MLGWHVQLGQDLVQQQRTSIARAAHDNNDYEEELTRWREQKNSGFVADSYLTKVSCDKASTGTHKINQAGLELVRR